MEAQERIIKFVTCSNWILFALAGITGALTAPPDFARGIICGGLIVTINFHLLYRTLKKAFRPPHISSHHVILGKYYLRFMASALIIFLLISQRYVNPLGLLLGLSVVVVSMLLATLVEIINFFAKGNPKGDL